jgi:hypothetical protein
VNDDRDYTVEQIARGSAAIRECAGGVDENVLVDELYVASVAARLVGHYVNNSHAIRWTTEHQERILLFRGTGWNFPDVFEITTGEMLRACWLERFFHGAHPQQPDPRNSNTTLAGPLEELSMNANIDVRFVVQAYLETSVAEREELLEKLADTSRRQGRDRRQL